MTTGKLAKTKVKGSFMLRNITIFIDKKRCQCLSSITGDLKMRLGVFSPWTTSTITADKVTKPITWLRTTRTAMVLEEGGANSWKWWEITGTDIQRWLIFEGSLITKTFLLFLGNVERQNEHNSIIQAAFNNADVSKKSLEVAKRGLSCTYSHHQISSPANYSYYH